RTACAAAGRAGRRAAGAARTARARLPGRQKRAGGCRRAVLGAAATLVHERGRAVVRRDRVEVALRDADQRVAVDALVLRHDALRRRVRLEVYGIEQHGRARAAETHVALAHDVPLALGDLAILDAHAHGHDANRVAFHDRAVVG